MTAPPPARYPAAVPGPLDEACVAYLSSGWSDVRLPAVEAAVRALAESEARRAQLAPDRCDEVATRATGRFVLALREGGVTPGLEVAYARRIAKNAVNDVFRDWKRHPIVPLAPPSPDEDEPADERHAAESPDPEEAIDRARRVEALRELLSEMPPHFRRAVGVIDLAESTREQYVQAEVRRRLDERGLPPSYIVAVRQACRQAEELLDKHAQRGREWLRARLSRER